MEYSISNIVQGWEINTTIFKPTGCPMTLYINTHYCLMSFSQNKSQTAVQRSFKEKRSCDHENQGMFYCPSVRLNDLTLPEMRCQRQSCDYVIWNIWNRIWNILFPMLCKDKKSIPLSSSPQGALCHYINIHYRMHLLQYHLIYWERWSWAGVPCCIH